MDISALILGKELSEHRKFKQKKNHNKKKKHD